MPAGRPRRTVPARSKLHPNFAGERRGHAGFKRLGPASTFGPPDKHQCPRPSLRITPAGSDRNVCQPADTTRLPHRTPFHSFTPSPVTRHGLAEVKTATASATSDAG